MDAWRQRGYAPPGSERMLQDYEDALQLERDKQSLIFALQYLPPEPPPSAATSPPAATPQSTDDTGRDVLAEPYLPSRGVAPAPQREDWQDGRLGLAGGGQAIRKMPDYGGDAYADTYLPRGIRADAPAFDTNQRQTPRPASRVRQFSAVSPNFPQSKQRFKAQISEFL